MKQRKQKMNSCQESGEEKKDETDIVSKKR